MTDSTDLSSSSDVEEPEVEAAAREVTITFNNFTSSTLNLYDTSLSHGIFNPGPPQTISAGTSATWKAESSGVLTGTEGYVWYRLPDSQTEFELYWNNPAIGSNSYGSQIKNETSGDYGLSNTGTSGNSSKVTYSLYENVQRWSGSSWMKGIEDGRSIGRLSIPGTHESCARYSPDGDILGVIICQDQTITQQLNSGIRFLDIRCRVENGVFTIHHDVVYQNMNFGDVLNECVAFLSSNPSETILMRIKQEYSTASDSEFTSIFNNQYYNGRSSYLYVQDSIPVLGDVRGKITVISNVSGLPGIPWSSLTVQDNYNPSDGLVEKIDSISQNLSSAISNHQSNNSGLYLNFISKQGVPLVQSIGQAAAKLNAEFLNLLAQKNASVAIGIGIIAMDFPNRSGGVIPVIINTNFRLVNDAYYKLSQASEVQGTAGSNVTIRFTFETDNRPAESGARLHVIAPPNTRIVAMSSGASEKLTIASDGSTADIVAVSPTTAWQKDRTISLSINSGTSANTVLTGSVQYISANGIPGAQTDLSVVTFSFVLTSSATYHHMHQGETVVDNIRVWPYDEAPAPGATIEVYAPPNSTIESLQGSNQQYFIAWHKKTALVTFVRQERVYTAYLTLRLNDDAPMDSDFVGYLKYYAPDGSPGSEITITLNTASAGITGGDFFSLGPGETQSVKFDLETSELPAVAGSRVHVELPEYCRVVDMSCGDAESLSVSADGRIADLIADGGNGPWGKTITLTIELSSDAPADYIGIGDIYFYGASGMQGLGSGNLFVLPAGVAAS